MYNKLKRLFKYQSVIINENGYKICPEGKLHRVIYYHYNPDAPKDWHVHHIDCNKLNNTLDNLIALPPAVHYKVHREIKRTGRIITKPEFQAYIDQCVLVLDKMKTITAQIKQISKTIKLLEEEKENILSTTGFARFSFDKKKVIRKSKKKK